MFSWVESVVSSEDKCLAQGETRCTVSSRALYHCTPEDMAGWYNFQFFIVYHLKLRTNVEKLKIVWSSSPFTQCVRLVHSGILSFSGQSWFLVVKLLQCIGLVGIIFATGGTVLNVFLVRSRSLKQAAIFISIISG